MRVRQLRHREHAPEHGPERRGALDPLAEERHHALGELAQQRTRSSSPARAHHRADDLEALAQDGRQVAGEPPARRKPSRTSRQP